MFGLNSFLMLKEVQETGKRNQFWISYWKISLLCSCCLISPCNCSLLRQQRKVSSWDQTMAMKETSERCHGILVNTLLICFSSGQIIVYCSLARHLLSLCLPILRILNHLNHAVDLVLLHMTRLHGVSCNNWLVTRGSSSKLHVVCCQ